MVKMKKIAALCAAGVLGLSCLAMPMQTVAAELEELEELSAEFTPLETYENFVLMPYEEEDTFVTIKGLVDKNVDEIIVPEMIDGRPVERIYRYAFEGSAVKKAVLPDTIKKLGGHAFYNCSNLTDIQLSAGLTTLYRGTFDGCTSLERIVIPDSVTTIESGMFSGSPSLREVVLPQGLTSIRECTFSHCSALTDVVIPEGVTTIRGCAFSECTALADLTIPASVNVIESHAFDGTPWLAAQQAASPLVIVNGILVDGSGAEGVVEIPEGVTDIAECAFTDNKAISGVTFADSVKRINNCAFSGCDGLTSVTIPETVSEIGGVAFSGCTNLSDVEFPDQMPVFGHDVFYNTQWLSDRLAEDPLVIVNGTLLKAMPTSEKVVIPEGVTTISERSFANGYVDAYAKEVLIPNTVREIGREAFMGWDDLASISFPESVEKIGFCALACCDSLRKVTVYNPDCDIVWDFDGSTLGGYFNEVNWDVEIYGYAGSTAEAFAERFGKKFYDLTKSGDVNNDDVVDSGDAEQILTSYASISVNSAAPEDISGYADINVNSVVDTEDAYLALSYYAYKGSGGTLPIDQWLVQNKVF